MSTYDWSRFVLRVPIQSGPAVIYDAWTSQAGLESWFLRKALFYRNGNPLKDEFCKIDTGVQYEWWWYGYPDEVVERGTILSANGKDLLKFSFGKAGNVTVSIGAEGGQSLLRLEQEDIPVDEESRANYHIGCTKGWLFYLANLKSVIEGGLDLRNKSLDLKEVINS